MRRMGLEALSRKPPRSRRHPAHTISPYLLRDLTINRPPPVWAADSPYLPMARGFVSLGAVLDWASRRVVAGRLATTLTTDFSLDAGQEAVVRDGTPEMFNADQGGQFTSQAFTGRLTHHGMQLSMDGNGWRRDTVFVERRWKSLKYEEVVWHALCRSTTRPGRHGGPPRNQQPARHHVRNAQHCPTNRSHLSPNG